MSVQEKRSDSASFKAEAGFAAVLDTAYRAFVTWATASVHMPIARDSGTSNKDAVDLDSLDLKYLEEGRVPEPLHEALTAAHPRERVGRGGGVHDANTSLSRGPYSFKERMAQKQDNRDTVFRVTNSWPSATTRNFLLLSELFQTDFPALSALRGTIIPRSAPYGSCDKWHRGLKAVEEKIWNAWMGHDVESEKKLKSKLHTLDSGECIDSVQG
ncbi:hypothetical protein K438DRAFT_1758811 [Mycena galopus ATCC 62051]|nr:hypothetical protein K438DRAFT_1758811 [Mycena galopus ATCC 62051]